MLNFLTALFEREDPNLKRLRQLQQQKEAYKQPKRIWSPPLEEAVQYAISPRRIRAGW